MACTYCRRKVYTRQLNIFGKPPQRNARSSNTFLSIHNSNVQVRKSAAGQVAVQNAAPKNIPKPSEKAKDAFYDVLLSAAGSKETSADDHTPQLYDPDEGLKKGTMFSALYKPLDI